jgi:DNA replication and repair protein RecF
MARPLSELAVHSLRNITYAKFILHPQCNLFFGPNGSGKTTLLEAIYLLCSGHSFRTREVSPLVNHYHESFTVFARTVKQDTVSIQKSISGPTQVKLNGQSCTSSSDLARFLPCQVFYQDIFQIIDTGPATRRILLDWGMFHVEHTYHMVWKAYRMVLKQRNALLRQKANRALFAPWDKQLVELAIELDRMRDSYFKVWSSEFQQVLGSLTDVPCSISYYKGWDRKQSGKSLAEVLDAHFNQDIQRQFTHVGPHQADIAFDLSSKKAKLLLSRGQQKVVLIALKLAQAKLVPKMCLYLFDDIAAELDDHHLTRVIDYLTTVSGQLFFTAFDDRLPRILKQSIAHSSFQLKNGIVNSP